MENERQWYYYPPEVTEVLLKKKERPDLRHNFPSSLANAWCIDIYSLGVIMLELAIGFPLWTDKKILMVHFN